MKRIPEPELMNESEQARAYAEADFEESNTLFVDLFCERFPGFRDGRVLDMGCGPADITIRLAGVLPEANVDGVDGASEMLRFGRERLARDRALASRVTLIEGLIPGVELPVCQYDALVSNSLLHHLHRPEVLWQAICELSSPGAAVLIMDLFRPESLEQAESLVESYAPDAPAVLQQDFYNSLLAAFSQEEVRLQLIDNQIDTLVVETVSDRHMLISGSMP
jgi:SAM-dependent methyltransferase